MGHGKSLNAEGQSIKVNLKAKSKKPVKRKKAKKTKAKSKTKSKTKKKAAKRKKVSNMSKAEVRARGTNATRDRILQGFQPEVETVEKSDSNPVGRPSEYNPIYCKDLIDHMKKGNMFESFGAYLYDKYGDEYGVARRTLYLWAEKHPEFMHAKEVGTQKSLDLYQSIGRRAMNGQLMRIKSEKPILDVKGEITLDAEGKVVIEREFEHAQFASVPWKFTMKNVHGWRDNIEITGDDRGPIKSETKIDLKKLSTKQLKLLAEILKRQNEED